MKKLNKKGFTIVELVIVIAVIAILASVMIPTFTGIVDKANKSAAEQAATSLWKELYATDLSDGKFDYLDNEQAITLPTGVTSYDETNGFVYADDNYTVTGTYNTTDKAWTWESTPVA